MQTVDEIVVFKTYGDPVLAHIVRARFEYNGIPSFVDENMSYVYPLYNTAMGGVKLKIFARDFDRCKAVIAQDVSLAAEDISAKETDDDAKEIKCPFCMSNNVRQNTAGNKALGGIILGALLGRLVQVKANEAWHCFNCAKKFY